MELQIRKYLISFTEEIGELAVGTLLSVNGYTIMDHLYDLPMQKSCP